VISIGLIVAEVEDMAGSSVVGAKVATGFIVDVTGFNEDVSEETLNGFKVVGYVVTTTLSVGGAE